ncbi:G-protein coupled receptor activity protein [Halocaridina rubra]|uniref:G-protein coupled receptor activity protein n=1 Tax=Halocaridina rubra TaxID=373956 RepID=A0AAN9AHI6_HALRR
MPDNISSVWDYDVSMDPILAVDTTEQSIIMDTTVNYPENQTYQATIDNMCLETYNSFNNGTETSSKLFRFVMYGVFLTIIGLLGLAGNIISITILSRPKMRSSINCCLIGLTSFDMIVTSTSILMFAIPEITEFTGTLAWYSNGVYQRVTPVVYALGLTAQTGSVYLTVTVTMERYVAVCRPLRARSLCTYGRAKIYVVAVALFSVLYNLPRFWEVTYQECIMPDDRFVIVVPSSLRQNPFYIQIYIMWMYLLIMYLVPFLSLLIFNSFIYKEVRAANHERQRLSRLERKEIGLAVMLLVVVTVFFLCNVLAFILNVLELLDISVDNLTITSNLLVTVNSSVNFIIYCIFGQKFRKLFLKMFCSQILPHCTGREASLGDSAIFVNNSVYGESRGLTNGGATETIRLTSWSGHRHSNCLYKRDSLLGPPCASNASTRLLKRGMHFQNPELQPSNQEFN